MDDAAQSLGRGEDELEQLWELWQWGCARAEDAEKPREGEEGSTARQEGLEMGNGSVGRAAGRKTRGFPKAGIRKSLLLSSGENSSQPAAPKAEP